MARRPHRLKVDLGGTPAFKLWAPEGAPDIYYKIMEMNWLVFVTLVILTFLLINLMFGLIYAHLPGTVTNAAPDSVLDGFFFSIETLATVGYGDMAPANHLGHALAAVEVLIGLFFSATMTGLIFARFARPRDSLVFSQVAVIGSHQGQRALMVRVASIRARPLANVTAQMAWFERLELPNGRENRRLTEVALLNERNPMLGLSWTIVHLIQPDSPLLAALASADRFNLIVTVGGLDTLLANQVQGGHNYQREDILFDHDFVDVVSEQDGALHLDMTRLHDTIPM